LVERGATATFGCKIYSYRVKSRCWLVEAAATGGRTPLSALSPSRSIPAALLAVEDRAAEVHREADAEHEGEIAFLFGADDLAVAQLARLAVERLRTAFDDLGGRGDATAALRYERRQPRPFALLLTVSVVVDAGAALDAEALLLAQLPDQRLERQALVGGDGVEHPGGDVEAGLITELERAHRKDLGAHRLVDNSGRCAFAIDLLRLQHVGAEAGVHQEARRAVLQDDRRLVDAAHERVRGGDRFRGGLLGGDDLDQLHHRMFGGAEEMQVEHVAAVAAAGGEICAEEARTNRARVGRYQSVLLHPGAERAVELRLDLAILHARFDHQVAVEEIRQRAGHLHAAYLAVDIRRGQRALLHRALVFGAHLVGDAGGELWQRNMADHLIPGFQRQPADGIAHVPVDPV